MAAVSFPIWSTTATLVVTDTTELARAEALLLAELAAVEAACSRFRVDSELSELLTRPGRERTISPLLNDLMSAALHAYRATGGLVDPTVAAAVIALGYRDDIAALSARTLTAATAAGASVPGAALIRHRPADRSLTVPPGVGIDLGATAKAAAADRAADRIAEELGVGVLVGLGGDIAVAGPAPAGGWRIAVGADHRTAQQQPEQVVTISSGGLATSATTVRSWRLGAIPVHHIVDPRTGRNPEPYWLSVSATAGSCLDANAATTASIVLGDAAPEWLAARGIAARLRHLSGTVTAVAGWPAEIGTAAA